MVMHRTFALLVVFCACAQQPGTQGEPGPVGPQGPAGPAGSAAVSDPGVLDSQKVIVNGTQPQNGNLNITGTATVGYLTVKGPVEATSTWGLNAVTNGLMVMPEGAIYDDGAGKLTLTAPLVVMNPAAGSFIRVAPGSYTLAPWGYLYVDLPPTGKRGVEVAPQVGQWTDGDRSYDARDRLVLAQRNGQGAVHLRFQAMASAAPAPSSLITMIGPNLGDYRNQSGVANAGDWWTIPNRSLNFTKRFGSSKLKITYQDTLGTLGQYYQGCEWQILLDGQQVAFFSDADGDQSTVTWRMTNAAHVAWANGAAGQHTVVVQNRGQRGAWGSGTNQCLQGWNTVGNFLSVEEIP
jgi:hypothetical protein